MHDQYTAAVDHLYALGHELAPPAPLPDGTLPPRRKFDLAHMRVLMTALGDPQLRFPSVLIAGTNGKGSTAATLASILSAAGIRTGLYTSPHLVRINERIRINGREIPDDDFARIYFHVDDTARHLVEEGSLPYHPSFFEVVTAIAFCHFGDRRKLAHPEDLPGICADTDASPCPNIDIAVLEVGLGGRLDATNIVHPILSILTDIALDHQDYLGPTIAHITREKAGILRPTGTLITLPQHPEANQALGEIAAAMPDLRALSAAEFLPAATPAAPPLPELLERCASGRKPHPTPILRNRYSVLVDNEPLEVDSPLPGQHQRRNLALAIAAARELRNRHGYNLSNAAIAEGIRNTRWPGRLELIRLDDRHDLLLDVAHNPAGAWTLRAALATLPENRPRTLIFSCLKDKPLEELSRILFPLFDSSPDADPARRRDHLILAPIDNPRAATAGQLLAAAHALSIPAHAAPHAAAALAQARQITPPGGLILATGSVYLIGELRPLALAAHEIPPSPMPEPHTTPHTP